MLPIGPLMIEHRLIERMIKVAEALREDIQVKKKANPAQVDRIICFIKSYADRCHHGKEEKEAMIRAGYESDSRVLHEEFVELVKDLEVKK
jgi:hemerythrin-like domain-containing protein